MNEIVNEIAEITFMGAARQVTGSSYLLQAGGLRVLIDCGMYQERQVQDRNWRNFAFPADEIDAIIITHAHLDHCGLLPKLAREGFRGRVYGTEATADIVGIALLDSAHIQEEDAALKQKRHKKEGRTGPHPDVPLYTIDEVRKLAPLAEPIPYDRVVELNDKVKFRFRDAGHILGSAMVEIDVNPGDGRPPRKIIFSGDIGQLDMPFVRDPHRFQSADYIVMESTYGDRDHTDSGPSYDLLTKAVLETIAAGGNVVIPTFAIERAQDLLFYLNREVRKGAIKRVPVYLDSPMATQVMKAFDRHSDYFDEESLAQLKAGESPFSFPGFKVITTFEESQALNGLKTPSVIMAGSGMCTGGRIKHHLIANLPRPESTVLFVGYQAMGTLGRRILDGEKTVRIHGQDVAVKAKIGIINGFSAHADRGGLLDWLGALQNAPRALFVCHGEEKVAVGFAETVRQTKSWNVKVPYYLESIPLD